MQSLDIKRKKLLAHTVYYNIISFVFAFYWHDLIHVSDPMESFAVEGWEIMK